MFLQLDSNNYIIGYATIGSISDSVEVPDSTIDKIDTTKLNGHKYVPLDSPNSEGESFEIIFDDNKYSSEQLATAKLQKHIEISGICNSTILNGLDIELSVGTKHFSLSTTDQLNLFGKQAQLLTSADKFEYHSDGDPCIFYSRDDMTKIINSATSFISYHTTYCNSIFTWIENLDSISDIESIQYGADVPEEYQSEVLKEYLLK